jgi:methylmalonyl-CoA epimerase
MQRRVRRVAQDDTTEVTMKIDHLGIAVKDLEAAVGFFRDRLGLKLKETTELPERGLRIAFFEVGEVLVELLAPMGEGSEISRFLERKGEGFHHVAFTTGDIGGKIGELTAAGVAMATPKPSLGAEGFPIAFVHPRSAHGVLLELIEKKQ